MVRNRVFRCSLLFMMLLPIYLLAQQSRPASPSLAMQDLGIASTRYQPEIGYSIDIRMITKERMLYAKSLGIQYVELAGIGAMLDKKLQLNPDKGYWERRVDTLKAIFAETGMQLWSIHMPFSKQLDLSLTAEDTRSYVVETQLQVFSLLAPLKPKVVLFHPSYYLGLGERAWRASQLVKSVHELNRALAAYPVTLVMENMLGPALHVDANRERPLLRTVAECVQLFQKFPQEVGIAVDMCHTAEAAQLLSAFGPRVKSLHIADGDGTAEHHYLPCNGLGKNNWNTIIAALEQINYQGVFMYECKYADERQLTDCYSELFTNYAHYKSKK